MIWLLLIVFILQTGFHWIFQPLIAFSTPVLELRILPIIFLAFFLWIFAGRETKDL